MKNKYDLNELVLNKTNNHIGIITNILISNDDPTIYVLFVLNKTFSSYEWAEEKDLVRVKEEDTK